ncbi:hypothetical protein D9M72_314090 [compost metagenome]
MRQQVQLAGHLQHCVAGQGGRGGEVPRALEAEPLGTRNRGNAHDVKEGELPDGGSEERPDAQLRGLPQANPAPAEPGPESQTEPEHRDQQDGCLGHHADGGKSGYEKGLGGSPVVQRVGISQVGSEDPDEHAQAGNGHDVVQNGCPHCRAECPVGVQHLSQEGVQAVEEDLRQAPEREGHRE